MKKRITSLCLIVLMLCAMCGTSVFAAELPSESVPLARCISIVITSLAELGR